jgi:serine protease inhibitor ecotin
MESGNNPFLPDGRQWAWNSSSLNPAKTCSRKYYYEVICGYVTKDENVHLTFGGIYASALERYHRWRADGTGHDAALTATVYSALVESYGKLSAAECADLPGAARYKTRENLIRSIVWYLDEYENDSCETVILADGKPAVELTFKFKYADEIWFTGHLDRLVRYAGDYYVQDQKAQPLSTKVLTPNGWKEIRDLLVGDEVIGRDGKPIFIEGLYPKGITKVYRVSFNDKTSVLCGVDHLWTVSTQMNSPWETKDVELIKYELENKKGWKKYHIPLVKPIQHPHRQLPLDPYVLGVLLGDGYLGGNSPVLSTSYDWLAESVAERLPTGDTIRKYDADNYSWGIKGQRTRIALEELGLWGKLSASKFVPDIYLFSSEAQRRDLLRGLLVTDGTWDGQRRKFDSTSKYLIEAVCSLVRSLGGNARYHKRTGEATGWRVSLRLPELPSKAGKRYITGITREADDETMCIKVSAADGLYVTENYTVTHNTTGSSIGPWYFKRYNPDNQISLYTAAGSIVFNTPVKGVMVDAAQIAMGFTRFERGFSLVQTIKSRNGSRMRNTTSS